MAYRTRGRFANPNPNMRGRFSNPNRKSIFLYLNHVREGGYPSPNKYSMKVEISFFSGNLDIESFLDWIYEEDKFFSMTYSHGEANQVCAYKLKGEGVKWWDHLQITSRRQDKLPVMT